MIRIALRELKHRPRRLLATWAGIALSVGFLVATQILAHTEVDALAKINFLESRQADIIIAPPPSDSSGTVNFDAIPHAISAAGLDGANAAPSLGTQSTVGEGANAHIARITAIPSQESLRAGTLTSGSWPSAKDEFVASAHDADALHMTIGDTIEADGSDLKLVGLTTDPHSVLDNTVLVRVPMSWFTDASSAEWMVKVAAGTDVASAVDELNAALKSSNAGSVKAFPSQQYFSEYVANMTGDINPLEVVANAFGALSLVVGTIMVSTTFAILLAQRRRQIALMRMIGASTRQVRRGLLIEAILVGVIGAALGVLLGFGAGVGVSAWSGSLGFGLVVPWAATIVAFVLGVLATVVAAWVPVRRAMRVSPMEAIRESVTSQTRTFSVARVVMCSLAIVAGIGLTVATFFASSAAFILALASGVVLAIGILAASPIFVPPMLRAIGAGVRRLGPIPRLAVSNATRNASRSAATATALMLAVGLVVTLQVATATTKAAATTEMGSRFPLDVSVTAMTKKLPSDAIKKLEKAPDVAASVVIDGSHAKATLDWAGGDVDVTMLKYTSGIDDVLKVPAKVSNGHVKAGFAFFDSDQKSTKLTLTSASGKKVTVVADLVDYLGAQQILADASTYESLATDSGPTAIWMKAKDMNNPAPLYSTVTQITGTGQELEPGGSLIFAAIMAQVLDGLLIVATILAGVAIVIALIGVGNTLGLSVLERTRESALLRALGLQRRGLRASLAIEALLIGVVGVVVGLAVGTWFGWFASAALMISGNQGVPTLAVDPLTTGGLTLIALAAAVAASVLPGRRAAMATPVEALADVD